MSLSPLFRGGLRCRLEEGSCGGRDISLRKCPKREKGELEAVGHPITCTIEPQANRTKTGRSKLHRDGEAEESKALREGLNSSCRYLLPFLLLLVAPISSSLCVSLCAP
ncbi:hypothetical protein CRG98_031393 [Punica granatum]|uniref:Uncharacterized protein n=1 Tax=Punica granatum TaxID=22663 RepID=A0A2I0IXP5_PUNGR|nr:hypothetical protein CRG98_031393 [Punica granatum]